jgi:hypothetical protein
MVDSNTTLGVEISLIASIKILTVLVSAVPSQFGFVPARAVGSSIARTYRPRTNLHSMALVSLVPVSDRAAAHLVMISVRRADCSSQPAIVEISASK